MRHDLIVSKSIDISATPGMVWDALTNPAKVKEYLYGTETLTDWKVGSEVIFQGEYQGHQYRDRGIVLQNVPLELLSYSYWSGFSGLEDKPENYSKVTYGLKDLGNGQTRLTWTQEGFASEEGYNHSAGGLEAFLATVKVVAEKGES
jgi:uncharacterized protein YndB with AHSA1/START domain